MEGEAADASLGEEESKEESSQESKEESKEKPKGKSKGKSKKAETESKSDSPSEGGKEGSDGSQPLASPEAKSEPAAEVKTEPAGDVAPAPAAREEAVLDATQRRSFVASAAEAVKYIDELRANDSDVAIRGSDRVTNILMGCAILAVLVPFFFPMLPMPILVLCDLTFGVLLWLFLVSRFGLIKTLPPRQALLVWEMILGATILGAFLTINAQCFMTMVRGLFSPTI